MAAVGDDAGEVVGDTGGAAEGETVEVGVGAGLPQPAATI